MSDYNGYPGWGCGFGSEIIILMLFFAMMNNNGNGLFGGNNTAAETAALVQQDNLRSLAANTNATTNWTQQLVGGAVTALERIGDKVDRNLANTQQQFGRLDTNLCQLGNNIAQQINGVNTNVNEHFCRTNQHIDSIKDQIIGYMTTQQIDELRRQNSDLKCALQNQQNSCQQDANTRAILSAIAQNGQHNGGCGGGFGQASGGFYGAPWGAPWGAFGCNTNYQNAVLSNLSQMTQSLNTISQTQAAQGTTLTAIQTRVNQIPTTAAAA